MEAALKIGGAGFAFSKGTYLRDNSNILDFVIVVSAWVERLAGEGLNLTALRTLRILRPLRSISSIEGLKVLILALISSIRPLIVSMILFVFFLCIFAIAGVQLWMGLFKMNCMDLGSGVIAQDSLCGHEACPALSECVKVLDNPSFGTTNFDNILFALLSVFQSVTLEGWTAIMNDAQKAFSPFVVLYFVPLVFIGAFLLLNFTLAVIKSSFTRAMNEVRVNRGRPDDEEDLNSSMIQDNGNMRSESTLMRHEGSSKSHTFKTAGRSNSDCRRSEVFNLGRGFSLADKVRHTSLVKYNTMSIGIQQVSRLNRDSDAELDPRLRTYNPVLRDIKSKTRDSLLYLLNHLGGNVKAKRQVVTRLRHGESVEQFVYSLTEDLQLVSESRDDVLPGATDRTSQFIRSEKEYTFCYMMTLKEAQKSADFALFKQLSVQNEPEQAFFIVLSPSFKTVFEVQEQDRVTKQVSGTWSGTDVNATYMKTNALYLEGLSTMRYAMWRKGFRGQFQKLRDPMKALVNHRLFVNGMTLAVILNTLVLALDHHGISTALEMALDYLNYIFTVIFIAEMVTKMIGLGLVGYFRDSMNYLDAFVVLLSCVEIVFLSGNQSAFTAFRTVRIFRTFRVLRVARLFRYMESMAAILKALSSSIYTYMYLAILLLLFTTIFALLGMQIFGGKFNFPEGTPRANFDTFNSAFITVFQVLSLENWHLVLFNAMRSSAGQVSCLFFICWIFLGNFVLLNLFLAILLDSFGQQDSEFQECESSGLVEEKTEEDSQVIEFMPSMRRASMFTRLAERKKRKIHAENMRQIELMKDYESEDESRSLEDLRRIKSQLTRRPLFEGADCERSYFLFSKQNLFRIFLYKMTNSGKFENAILGLICLSSVKLVWDTYILDEPEDSFVTVLSSYLDVFFTVCFALEFLIKSVSIGLVLERGSYLREGWNQIDASIVVLSITELSVQGLDIPFIKVLRLLRTLRPLRFISHNPSMKLVVTALLESLFAILNVVIMLLVVWLMFAILGMSLFGGKFYSCENPEFTTLKECEEYGYDWGNSDIHFDNTIQAMVTLFIISSLEGWPDIMYQAVDARDVDFAPEKDYNPAAAYYFVAFIFIGSFFFVNFFIGVVFMEFNKAKTNENSVYTFFLTKKQMKWIEMQAMVLNSRPQMETTKTPTNPLRLALYRLSKHWGFEMLILGCIVLNMLQMAIAYEGASEQYTRTLEAINLSFTIVFAVEAVVKFTGLGGKTYFSSNWNKFDFVVVLASVLDLSISYFYSSGHSMLIIGPQLARTIRVLRVSRLLRIFKALKSLQDLITIMAHSLPAIINVLSLSILLFFIFSILGVFLFNGVDSGAIIDNYNNFSNFGMAMIILFRISTGEDWQFIMNDCKQEVGGVVSTVYFASFVTITMFVMLNLFIMVIVQIYEDYEKDPKNALQLFTADVKKFKREWAKYAESPHYIKIDYKSLPDFMWALGTIDRKLGVEKEIQYNKMIRILSTMDILIDPQGYVYYNDILYAILKRKHYKRGRGTEESSKKILKRHSAMTEKKLAKLRDQFREQYFSSRNLEDKKYNLFLTMMYARSVFRAWKNWTANRVQNGSSGNITPRMADVEFPGDNSIESDVAN